jgi:type I restriction enzyme R subunit
MPPFTIFESDLEQSVMMWLQGLGYLSVYGPTIAPAPDGESPERENYADVIMAGPLNEAIARLNPGSSAEVRAAAVRRVRAVCFEHPDTISSNRAFHKLLIEGVSVEISGPDGEPGTVAVRLLDLANPSANVFWAVNQFTVIENGHNRRPDVVLFVNGLPIGVIELKNPADVKATVLSAFNQLQTYKQEIPSLLAYNELCVIGDGLDARAGSLTAKFERYMRWRTIDGVELAPAALSQMEVLVRGLLAPARLVDVIANFIAFEEGDEIDKKLAAYHQYHATNKAVLRTLAAAAERGDRRGGVVWHTQGSGKSLTMVYYAGKVIQALGNPTLVVLTDRNDLDDQLFGTFSRCSGLLHQTPVQSGSREHLRELLRVAAGGVVFTTIQKFFPVREETKHPLLSDRRNIVVIADEAHRSQYEFQGGFAGHLRDALPNASFIGFTGTPIETGDASTRAVFGEYVDIYDIARSVEDKATVPIYYEPRLARLGLSEAERPKIDEKFEEVTEGEEVERKERLKSKWAQLEAMVGADKRVAMVARDLVEHFERRESAMKGKAMVVAMSRRIAVRLYEEIVRLRPEWHGADDASGAIKVVMTGSAADPLEFRPHIRDKKERDELSKRFKRPADPFKIVIVRDMWLTGFDVPCLHTMYTDKPMHGHTLMQAIARVNRVFGDKPGGLVVDYLGLAGALKEAVADYTNSDGKGQPVVPQEQAVSVFLEKLEVVKGMMHGFNYSAIFTAPNEARWGYISAAMDHVLRQESGKQRWLAAVSAMSAAFALSGAADEALAVRDEVSFFQAVRAGLVKLDVGGGEPTGREWRDVEGAIQQIVASAVVPQGVIDVFEEAGMKRPDISVLSDEFLEEVKGMKHKNLALEALKRLLQDQLRVMERKFLVKSRSFSKMLEETMLRYQNRTLEAAQVIAELVELAKEIRTEQERGAGLGLTDDEVAFYDALLVSESAKLEMADDQLKLIARELVVFIRKSTTVDWTMKDSVKASMRLEVKRLLKKHGYPPSMEEAATKTVIDQAEVLCKNWTGDYLSTGPEAA